MTTTKKNWLWRGIEFFFSLGAALLLATIIRQMWFEPQEIPTGSMRPTFKEQDLLIVSKTPFGLNIPLQTEHFFFDPDLVQRTGIVIWSGDGVPHLDSSTKFLGIVPYTKRFIKRCLGKPGDTLYFYGGKIYGMDREGNALDVLLHSPFLQELEHIPYNHFEGRPAFLKDATQPSSFQEIFHHFNYPVGRYRVVRGQVKGEIFDGKNWVDDQPQAAASPHSEIRTFSDFAGMRNFAMVRLVSAETAQTDPHFPQELLTTGVLFLEVSHTPHLASKTPLLDERLGFFIQGYKTWIPLQQPHLAALMRSLYTCRFEIRNGKARAYRHEGAVSNQHDPDLPGVPDGTYEFYYGKAYSIGWGGVAHLLPDDHPLYSQNPTQIQKLFNIGIDMSQLVEPSRGESGKSRFFPRRYAYFRNGDLYVMGGVLLQKEDPLLKEFTLREEKRQNRSPQGAPYVAFRDYGPPLHQDGSLDKEWIARFGVKIPEHHYLMLGDNHAMSQDSRYFGPVPEENLQGAPSFLLWPPSPRWGAPKEPSRPWITSASVTVWTTAAGVFLGYLFWRRKRGNKA